MKVWISKYALSRGIEEVTCKEVNNRYVSVVNRYGVYKLYVDAHTTREAAVSAAEYMRLNKIASLKKQIAKLEKMTFEDSK